MTEIALVTEKFVPTMLTKIIGEFFVSTVIDAALNKPSNVKLEIEEEFEFPIVEMTIGPDTVRLLPMIEMFLIGANEVDTLISGVDVSPEMSTRSMIPRGSSCDCRD